MGEKFQHRSEALRRWWIRSAMDRRTEIWEREAKVEIVLIVLAEDIFFFWIRVRRRIDIWDTIGGAPRSSGEIGCHWEG